MGVAPGERSFHIFYQALASAAIREKYELNSADPRDYGILKGGLEFSLNQSISTLDRESGDGKNDNSMSSQGIDDV